MKAANFSEKGKKYAAVIFVVITFIFGLVLAIEKMTSKPEELNNNDATAEEVETIDRPDNVLPDDSTVTNLVTQREEAKDSYTISQDAAPTVAERANALIDPIEKEKETFKLVEFRRARIAAQSHWNVSAITTVPASQNQKHVNVTTPTHHYSELNEDRLSTDEQRIMIGKRLDELASLKQRILSGNISEGSDTPTKVTQIEQSFSAPPENIVGFTQENSYNASTEGLLKLPIGTIIPSVTRMKANSDRTGTFKAWVTQDVLDASEEYVLIPTGSEVIIKSFRMSTVNESINSVIGMSVPWVVLPNGNKIDTSKSSGMDREGMTGISDQVDHHWMEQFLGVAAYALVASNTSYQGTGEGESSYYGDVSSGVREQVAPHAQKYLQLRPTNIIRAGQAMNIIIEDEIYLKPWKNLYEDYL
ncbi:TrbI/VirB10 family protein [Vibrio tapetis subsp. quintayensis]|uniref:TrbI/VirB10 family protein n=1 Tax=Vibrio tapetis TaxID=52443 RepID=UPI0025B39135|nr:TrbI/VirB10 family protein [Vibrio tapetis]MDN3683257.1 TrbI/VirB10 family protein [Vibrio tapetis subsp. quintayensis]